MNIFHQKLLIPNVAPYALRRAHVEQLLQTISTAGRAALLIAPAGTGKTTALVHWVQAQPPHVTVSWYSLDRADSDSLVFLRYVTTALAPQCPALLPIVQRLAERLDAAARGALIEQTIAVLAAQPWIEHLLILDNVQELAAADPQQTEPICTLVDLIIRYTPIRVVMASRRMLPCFIRIRVQGRVQILESSTLAFAVGDIRELAAAHYGLTLTPDQAGRLAEWSSGWPTAIMLALEDWRRDSIAAGRPPDELSLTSSTEHLFAFLAEQVFAPLPPRLQQFLCDTSVLDDLTAERCDALRGTSDSAQLLAEAINTGIYLLAQGGRVTPYGFFGKFLQQQLWDDPARARELTGRAARLYHEWGEYQAALERWLRLDDLAAASALVLAAGPKLRTQGEYATVLGWIDTLRARGALSPALLLLQSRIAADLADWNMAFVALQRALASGQPEIMAEAHLLEVMISCIRGEITHVSELLAAVSIETLPPHLQLEGYKTASRVAWNEGRVDEAIALLKRALALHDDHAATLTDTDELARIYDMLGSELIAAGDGALAVHYLRRADAAWQASGNERRRAITLNNLAVVATEEGRLGDARAYLEEGLRLAGRSRHPRGEPLLFCSLGDVALIEGRLEIAQAYYATAFEQASRLQMLNEQVYSGAGAWRAALLMGNEAEAARWQHTLDHLSTLGAVPYAASLAVTRALAAESAPEAAKYLAQAFAAPSIAAHDRAQALLLRAQCAYQQGGWTAALPHWQALEADAPRPHLDRLLQIQADATPGLLAAVGESALAQRLCSKRAGSAVYWEVRALGGFSIACNGQDCAKEVRPIDQLVILRLLEAGPVGLPALALWEDVWGEQPFSSDALRQSLSRIRRTIGMPVQLRLGHCQLQISWSSLAYDAALFETPPGGEEAAQEAAGIAVVERMLSLYRGAFLAHLNSESPWLAQRRAGLRRRHLYLREKLALAAELDEPHQALQICCAILDEDSCREVAAACAMRCAARLGDRALAITIYQRVCNQLVNDLGTDPSPLLARIYQQIA